MKKEVQDQLIKDHFLFKEGDRHLQEAGACQFWPKVSIFVLISNLYSLSRVVASSTTTRSRSWSGSMRRITCVSSRWKREAMWEPFWIV
jgi:hypothetical protein